jgi:hypothetical protein
MSYHVISWLSRKQDSMADEPSPDGAFQRVMKELDDCLEQSQSLNQAIREAQRADLEITNSQDRHLLERRTGDRRRRDRRETS